MSNFMKVTRNPATKEFEVAHWMDDHYGKHRYGVRFDDGSTYSEDTFTDDDFLDPDEEAAILCQKASEIDTWEDVGRIIAAMTPEQRKQPVQCVLADSDSDTVQVCLPGIAIMTVAQFEFEACRSVHNNKYCPDDVVMLLDINPHFEDGVTHWHWDNPCYGKDGPTDPKDQRKTS
jgi:hypothetical protein